MEAIIGITIFYRGTLRDVHQLPHLVSQIEIACGRLQWPCQVIDERILGTAERYRTIDLETDDGIPTSTFEIDLMPVDDHLRGIVVAPPGCEALHLTFGRAGQLIDYGDTSSQDYQPGRYGLVMEHLWTKTQFSSPAVHIQVCKLLQLVEPFMVEWEVTDEGGYWERKDEKNLNVIWVQYAGIITALSDPATLQELLDHGGLDIQVNEPPDVGKEIPRSSPLWRDGWGMSANEN